MTSLPAVVPADDTADLVEQDQTRSRSRASGAVRLADGVHPSSGGLKDVALGRVVPLDAPSRYLLSLLLQHPSVAAAARAAAARVPATAEELADQVAQLARVLNRGGLIEPSGPGAVRSRLRHLAAGLLGTLHGQMPGRQFLPTRRVLLPASTGSALLRLVVAMLPAAAVVFLGVFAVVLVLFTGTGVVSASNALTPALTLALAAAAGPLVHEAGHRLTLGRRPSALLQAGLRPSVAHGSLPRRRGLVVTAAGPLAGLVAGLPLILMSVYFDYTPAAAIGLVLCSQVLGLTVLAADGRRLCSDRSSRS